MASDTQKNTMFIEQQDPETYHQNGGRKVQLCGLAQYGNLIGVTVGYTITASISMV
ncbi:hypothetical protein Pint_08571 [Pistacia integerrima]|uniref:Uncharacterized protein n=1 Tax=Pistacia integerrima TaxID=434235 RepID=A0ACC0XTT1_9ROSI|nr:hypothetical protein Pint_08571 [Pistacia integerrima]